jgi:hypothetical protein
MALDTAKLRNVRISPGKTIAQCPACAEAGMDDSGEHLIINSAGSFGCVLNAGEDGKAHRARIFELAGERRMPPTQRHNGHTGRSFVTLDAASSRMAARLGMLETRRDIYVGADNAERFAVLRFDGSDRKEYRPFHLSDRGWSVGDPEGRLPLFNLPTLLARPNESVFVTEGEKAACELSTIGVLVTTSAHGAKSAAKTDWAPLADRSVVILPDNDDEGQSYALSVREILRKPNPPSRVKIVSLPGLPLHGDVVEWLAARDAQTPEDLRSELERLIDSSQELPESNTINELVESQTFTVQVLNDEDSRVLRAKLYSLERQKLTVSDKRKMMAAALIEALHNRGRFFFHSQLRDHKSALFFDSNRKLLMRLSDPSFVSWLALFTGVNRSENDFRFLHAAVEDEALQGKKTAGIVPETLWAARPGAIYISNGDGSMVRIRPGDVRLADNAADNVLFEQGATLPAWKLVEGTDPFGSRLFHEANFDGKHGLDLLRLWAMSLPANHDCKPPLVIAGEIRSGKTLLVRGLFQLLGIPDRIRQPIESEEGKRDFWIGANAGGLVCLDNADSNIRWLADAIATASTAGGIERKKNYDDTARINLQAKAWIAITSANPTFGNDSGLADRLLVVRMKTRDKTISESELLAEIKERRDAGLSFIASRLAGALKDDQPVPTDLNKRHPDFAAFAVRIGRSLGRETEAIHALSAAEDDKPRFCLENDSFGQSLITVITQDRPFFGTAAELLERLKESGGLPGDKWTSRGIGKKLSHLWPHISALYQVKVSESQGTRQYSIEAREGGFVGLEDHF